MEPLDPILMDELLTDCKTPADVKNLYSQLLQRMINRSLEAELDAHLKYDKGERSDAGQRRSNTRNGKNNKTIKGDKASCRWKHRVTVTAALSQNWCKNAKYGWQGWKNTFQCFTFCNTVLLNISFFLSSNEITIKAVHFMTI